MNAELNISKQTDDNIDRSIYRIAKFKADTAAYLAIKSEPNWEIMKPVTVRNVRRWMGVQIKFQ